MSKFISLDKCLYILLIILSILMPFRELLSLYVGDIIKFIPDVLTLLLLMYYIIKNKFKIKLRIIDFLFLAFIFTGLIYTLYNHSSIMGFIAQTRSISVMYCLFYLLRVIPLEEKKYITIFKIIFYTSIALIIMAISEAITDKHLFFPLEWAQSIKFESNFDRVYGLLNNPNTFAIYLLLIMLMTWFLSEKEKLKVNWVYYYLSLTTIFLTSSRSTLILLILLLIFLLIWIIKNKKYFKIATISFLLIASFSSTFLINFGNKVILEEFYNGKRIDFIYAPDYNPSNPTETPVTPPLEESENNETQGGSILERVEEILSGKTFTDSLTNGRIYNILLGLRIFKDNLLFGTGFGTFGSAGSRIAGSHIYEEYNIHNQFYADNEYIKVLVETGIIGTLIYCSFLLAFGISSLKNVYKFLLFAITIFTGMFYNIFELQVIMFLIYLFFVIFDYYNKKEKSKINN